MSISWQQIIEWLEDQAAIKTPPDCDAPHPNKINTDSRKIKQGDFFVPIKGEKFDGHAYIDEALAKGATGFFYNQEFSPSDKIRAQGLAVKDTLTALQNLAKCWRRHIDPKHVIAITGSNGKTTVKEMLAYIGSEAGACWTTPRSLNNELGLPLTLLKAREDHQYIILEMGARHKGDIDFLCGIADPTIGCVLNVSDAHLGEFGSVETILETKTEMFQHATHLVFPADDERIVSIAKATGKPVTTFGPGDADVKNVSDEWNADGSMDIQLDFNGKRLDVHMNISHECFPINVAAAAAVASAADIVPEAITAGLSQYHGLTGRFQIHQTSNFIVVDDSYNASPKSMEAGLLSCQKLYAKQSRVAVLGDMLELGETSNAAHLALGGFCAKNFKPDLLITVGEAAKLIAAGAIEAGLPKDKVLSFDNASAAARLPDRVYTKRDVIFVKGSNAMGLAEIVQTLRELY